MTDTIPVSVSAPFDSHMHAFFESQGMKFESGLDGQTFFIELREKPSMLSQLEDAGYFKTKKKPMWEMLCISEHGVTLYIYNRAGDGYCFIPFSNILALITASAERLSDPQPT